MFPRSWFYAAWHLLVNNSPVERRMTAGFGLFGYALIKFGFEPAPLLLGFVLGKLMEEKLRQALVISRGIFMTSSTGRSARAAAVSLCWW